MKYKVNPYLQSIFSNLAICQLSNFQFVQLTIFATFNFVNLQFLQFSIFVHIFKFGNLQFCPFTILAIHNCCNFNVDDFNFSNFGHFQAKSLNGVKLEQEQQHIMQSNKHRFANFSGAC